MTAAQIAEVPYERVILAAVPFFAAIIASLILLAFVPAISLWVPNLISG